MANDQHAERLIGESRSFLEILEFVSQIAPLNKPVLLVGERGTGKELIAARLHYLSQRWDQEFLKMNCAAINDNLLESELFGHEAGSFTGAAKLHKGRFERADKGTLFLDELATTSPLVQEKLLRIIEYGEFERVGGSRTINTDVRLIAATNDDLPTLAGAGKFREDLLDRLAFDVITLPPLRERQDDIMLLAEYFGMNMALDLNREYFPGFSDRASKDLHSYHWPGNIRELKNVVERSVYRCQEPDELIDEISIDPFDSPFRIKPRSVTPEAASASEANSADSAGQPSAEVEFPLDLRTSIQEYEISLIESALATCQFNQKKTAEILGVTYHQLRGYLKKYDLLDN
ncbi:MAG: phage shock protein operon transcriptional activator [Pseudomonadales bacterium]|jgi:psp operon transcriptional activator|nr:phage shock protein operon transcriptional activator [Pseudomonadales bacterium]|tara:strand:+ start:1208 stop:2248 length:1041 start_codon:yes stop_codon:yes gene_type:complete